MLSLSLLLVIIVTDIFAERSPGPPLFPAPQYYPCVCYLPPDSGLCSQNATEMDSTSDLLTRYYFDVVTGQCYPFAVQNCGGNENRFRSQNECQKFCRLNM